MWQIGKASLNSYLREEHVDGESRKSPAEKTAFSKAGDEPSASKD